MKKIFAVMLVLLMGLSFAGCGEENSDTKVAGYDILESGILKDMEGANSFDTLMEKYGKITIGAVGRDNSEYGVHLEKAEGGYCYYTYDATGVEYAATPEGQFVVTSDGESQSIFYQNEEEKETMMTGVEDAVRGSLYKYNETEKVVEQEEKDGYIVVTTAVHMTSEIEGYLEFKSAWGIDDEEFDFFNEYVLDKETLEIVENKGYCVVSTGRLESGQATLTYGQDYVVSDALKACMESAQ